MTKPSPINTFRLALWIPTIVVVMFLIISGIQTRYEYKERITLITENAQRHLYESALQLAHTLEYALANQQLEQVQSAISGFVLGDSAQLAVLVNSEGRVSYSSQFAWKHLAVEDIFDSTQRDLLANSNNFHDIQQYYDDGRLLVAVPLNLTEEPLLTSNQHPPVLILESDISYQLAQAGHQSIQQMLPSLFLFLLATLLFITIIQSIAVKPIQVLKGLAKQLHQQNFDLHNPLRGNTEQTAVGDVLVNTGKQLKQYIADVTDREQRLHITLQSIGDAVIVTDANGLITRINPVACRLTGWTEGQALGQSLMSVFDIYNANNNEPIENPVSKVLETGDVVELSNSTLLLARDGTRYHISDSAAPIRSTAESDAPILGVILVFQDVSKQYQLRQELKQSVDFLQSMLRVSPSVTYVLDLLPGPIFRLSYVTESVEGITGISADFWLENPHNWQQHIHPEDILGVMETLQRALSNDKPVNNRFRFRHKDGHYLYVQDCLSASQTQEGMTQIVGVVLDTSEQQHMLAENMLLGDILERSLNEIYIVDAETMLFTRVNLGARNNLGYSMEELQTMTLLDITRDMTQEQMQEIIEPLTNQELPRLQFEATHRRKDGSAYQVSISLQSDFYDDRKVYVAIVDDISERKQTEHALNLASMVFKNSNEGIIITNSENRIIRVNTAFTEMTGYAESEVLNQNPNLLKSGKHDQHFYEDLWQSLQKDGRWSGEIYNRRKNGEIYLQWLSITQVNNQDSHCQNFVAIMSDITKYREAEQRINFLAHHDVLTKLPNRALLSDRIRQAVITNDRYGQKLALLYLDLDRFKFINDSLGHAVGDLLLISVAEKLKKQMRDQDTVCRTGGDEFIILLPDTDADGAAHVAQKLIEKMTEPFEIEDNQLFITLSIGISIYPDNGKDPETLNKHADTAMYRAKHAGRNQYQFFTEEMHSQIIHKLELEHALRFALSREQLYLAFQPQVDLSTNKISGAEVLLRWHYPPVGDISPLEFIPVAEETGMINPIGHWILDTAIGQCKKWYDDGHQDLVMAINISAVQFNNPMLVSTIVELLKTHDLPPKNLELEITESVAMFNMDLTIKQMQAMAAAGIRLSLDDFGTGYSSLSYLKKFPINKLKIDQSFVFDMLDDPDDAAIVDAVITLAHSLGLKTLAEGVETHEHLLALKEKGCDLMQGFYFSKPISADDFENMLVTQSENR